LALALSEEPPVIGARVIFAIGLFGVPLLLLWLGHGLRKRSARSRGLFWGATTGYCIAMVVTTVFTMLPPYHWSTGSVVRDLVVHWSMLVLTVVGGIVGLLRAKEVRRGASAAKRSRPAQQQAH
jgi:hypothetical protein